MNSPYFKKSEKIANDFIQSIVFLDDKAYKDSDKENTDHDIDILNISKAFSRENKICAAYRPESDDDINSFKSIANKADVVVLDWQIDFTKPVVPGTEELDEPDEPRGSYTKDIINSILFDNGELNNSLKLIIVYTGDYTILKAITEDIFSNVFNSSEKCEYISEEFSIQSNQIKVVVRAKYIEVAFNANKENYQKYMIQYNMLPAFILTEFTKMTSGLLSNFALLSLTTLRKNSSKILGQFSKDMDSAYLGHKVTIPNQDDAEDLLIELFGDTVKDLLYYSKINENIKNKNIEMWLQDNVLEEDIVLPKSKSQRSQEMLKDILHSTEQNIRLRFEMAFDKINPELRKHFYKNPTKIFTNNSELPNTIERDKKFAKLTHHKSLFLPKNTQPRLTLGTLIKTDKSNIYYICIQQKCDSVRIPKGKERKFLFLPLTISEEKFDVLTPEGIMLKKDKNSFSIRTIKFICNNDYGIILAEKNQNEKYVFKQMYDNDEHFEWILDLKDLHSQRIITQYATKLSRVGLDESEWHRNNLSEE